MLAAGHLAVDVLPKQLARKDDGERALGRTPRNEGENIGEKRRGAARSGEITGDSPRSVNTQKEKTQIGSF